MRLFAGGSRRVIFDQGVSVRVLFITSAYPASEDDPRGTFIHELARALVEAGVQITVLAPGAASAPRHEVRDGVTVHRAQYWFKQHQGLATGLGGIVPNLRKRPWLAAQALPMIASLTWHALRLARAADVVHAHWVYPSGIAGVAASRWCGKPLVLTSHGGDLNLATRVPLLESLAAGLARSAAACIGVSAAMVRRFCDLGVDPKRVVQIPYGVRRETPQNGHRVESPHFGRFAHYDGLKVVYVGSLIARKSVRTLIDAARGLTVSGAQIRVAIVGDGPQLNDLRAAVAVMPAPDVVFVGRHSPPTARAWIAAADALVLPSLSEGRPLVVLEAMALGAVVVASDIDGTRDLVRHGETGLLFPTSDAATLQQHLLRLATDHEALVRLRREALNEVERQGLATSRIAQQHRTLYLGLAD